MDVKQDDLFQSFPLLGLMIRQNTGRRIPETLQYCAIKHTDKRRELGWPMKKIAEELGLSRATLYRWTVKFQGLMKYPPRPRVPKDAASEDPAGKQNSVYSPTGAPYG